MIVRLTGGLSNQMFMYAFGRALGIRRGQPVRFHWARSTWDYGLGKYNVVLEEQEPGQMKVYNETGFNYDINALRQPTDTYFNGYWQSEQYFLECGATIRQELTLKEEPNALVTGVAKTLRGENSVFIHVRRGDYTNPDTAAFHGSPGMDYYNRAIEYVREHIFSPVFYVFSDDPEWCTKAFPDFPTLSFPGSDRHHDLYLMSCCHHGIGANSTFGWWANWLGDRPGRICVFPKKWFANEAIETKDLIPDRWTRI